MSNLNLSKVLQVSIDGPCVNIKFQEALLKYREQCQPAKLIAVGSYQVHIIHGAFQAGANTTP